MSDEIPFQPRIKITWLAGILAAFALFVVIAVYSSHMTWAYKDYDQQDAEERYATLAKVRASATKTLTTADWVDQTKGTVRIPIEEAMVEELDTLKSKPLAMGGAIPAAVPPAPAKAAPVASPPSAGATNAAPAKPAAPAAKNAAASTNAAPAAATPPPAKPKQ